MEQQDKAINLEENKAIQSKWDTLAGWYEQKIELYSYQSWIYTAVQSQMSDKDRILEVACGPGKHSVTLATSFLKKGGVLVSCDYSRAMVDKLTANYQSDDTDYKLVKGNKFVAETEKDFTEFSDETNTQLKYKCDLEQIVKDQSPFRKLVYGCQVNNEILPFGDEQFGAYLASLSVHIVNNPENQVREAYRVLKKGSTAVFTVWGKREESLLFSALDMVLDKYVPADKLVEHRKQKSMFHTYDDKGEKLKGYMENSGFTDVKIFEAAQHLMMRTGEEMAQAFGGQAKGVLSSFGIEDESVLQSVLQDITVLYDKLSGKDTTDLKTFGIAVFIGFKN